MEEIIMKPAEGILFIACCVAHLYTWITARHG